jgi:three-Cys-motif partner protein
MTTFDEIGYWSEIKLDIVRDYAQEYSKILAAQTNPRFHHVYVDAFAGAGVHVSRKTKQFVPGSPLNALLVQPPFAEYYFIDVEDKKIKSLERLAEKASNVHVLPGDCNQILLRDVFPNIRYQDYRRGLCLLDPYGLHLDWQVILEAGRMQSVEVFLNFPVGDMNRNVLWRSADGVDPTQVERMNRYWGDETWRNVAYRPTQTLFGIEDEKTDNATVARAFRDRLQQVAGFSHVPDPIPMRNSRGVIVYYLFFASPKPVAAKIVTYIFDKYRNRRG